MKRLFTQQAWGSTKQILNNLFLITAGSLIAVVATNGILVPMGFANGGFVGLAMLLQKLFPDLPLGWLYGLLNLPLYILGWRLVGRRFLAYSLVGTVIFTLALQYVDFVLPLQDKVPAAVLAGIISGAGSGLILRSHGSAGGGDILSVVLFKRFSVRLGSSVLALNALVMIGVALTFSLQSAVYTLIFIYVSSQVLNLVVSGLSRRKAVHIISPQWELISQTIMEKLGRGVTLIPASGAYTHRSGQMVFTVIALYQISRLKELVHSLDPGALVVISDTAEVMGARIGNQPHW